MPLDKNKLKKAIEESTAKAFKKTMNLSYTSGTNYVEHIDKQSKEFGKILSEELSTILYEFIKTSTIQVQAGQTITIASAAGPMVGTTTSVGIATIN
jgi:hypothetical protein